MKKSIFFTAMAVIGLLLVAPSFVTWGSQTAVTFIGVSASVQPSCVIQVGSAGAALPSFGSQCSSSVPVFQWSVSTPSGGPAPSPGFISQLQQQGTWVASANTPFSWSPWNNPGAKYSLCGGDLGEVQVQFYF